MISHGTKMSAQAKGSQRDRVVLMLLLLGLAIAVLGVGWRSDLIAASSAVAGLLGLIGLTVAPLRLLPSIGMVVFLFFPAGYLSVLPTGLSRFYAPAVLIVALWAIRTVLSSAYPPRKSRRIVAIAACSMILCLLVVSIAGTDPSKGLIWSAVFAVSIALPALFASDSSVDWQVLVTTTMVSAVVLGVLAIAESSLSDSPLVPLMTFDQHWSVYRVTTTLGHPLFNGAIFAALAALAFGLLFMRKTGRLLAFLAFSLSSFAVLLSGSRSGVLAWAVGIGMTLLFNLISARIGFGLKLLGVGFLGVAFVIFSSSSVFAQRAASDEAAESGDYRAEVADLALSLLAQRPLGSGPGTSADIATAAGATLPLENALLGSLVSLGIIASIVAIAFILSVFGAMWAASRVLAIAPIAAVLAAGGAFPLWETNPAAFAFVGFMVMVGMSVPPDSHLTGKI